MSLKSLNNLTKRERQQLDRLFRQWQRRLKPLYDANRACQRITAEDLAVYIGPVAQEKEK